MFVLNTWYVAAWSTEVTRDPVRRVVCKQPLVLYRTQDGAAVALADRCAHRAYPLSAGRTVGDSVECGYHGFAYGPDGVCTRVPAQAAIPARARVRRYPVVEKDGWIWVWTGDADLADESLVPDTHWMNDPAWATVTHTMLFECRHDLIHDNLLDLTHETFLHKTTVGDDYIPEYGITVEVDGDVVTVDRFMPGVEAPPLYARTMGIEGLYDRFHATEFHIPGYHVLHSGITAQGRPREEGHLIKVLNGITPVDERTTWYYYAFSRNFAVDAEWATKELEVGLETVLREDADALREQETGMRERPDGEHDVLIGQDAGVAKARRILNRLLAAEQSAEQTADRAAGRTVKG
ncbi:Rieske 2Fe-2S domain-containing protein [Streptomyces sp. NPDC056190]|uniref:aromatic ring-hydroxylating dioxygenase subunit alpha n=1 Tax=unclassified Streptomyces TaxID=2593676 RepID=UPI0035E0533B